MKYKAMYRYELARAAGVSERTFARWLQADREQLQKFGANGNLLSPAAVAFICEKYCIFV